jgi:hypothetical protein
VDWEFSGFAKALEVVSFIGGGRQWGMASVTIDNYSSRLHTFLSAPEAFQQLVSCLRHFFTYIEEE